MGKCCGHNKSDKPCTSSDPCDPPQPTCSPTKLGAEEPTNGPLAWFGEMIQHCYDYAASAKAQGKPVVGIMCEYTPRELIMAADAVPVCLCGGSAEMIPPAEEHLPANLCPLIKSTYGYHVQGKNPFLEMADLIVAETTCDGKKKMYELMARTRPTYILELPQKPMDADAMTHWVSELRKFQTKLEEHFGVELTDEKIRREIRVMNRERQLRRQLAKLMKSNAPPLTGRQLLDFKSSISCIDADLEQYAEAIRIYESQRGNSAANSSVRVLLTGVPVVHGAERVMDIIESHGGLVVCMDNCTGLKPILEDVDETADDPILALAETYFRLPCSVMTKNDRRLQVLRDLAAEYRPQCVIDLIWQACITYDVESYLVKELAEKELGLPYLRIETDYSPSDSARIALRIEALFETIQHKAGKTSCSKA
ncbi:MAG: double-cubane-cluster-containing anaerobic reductase [Sedimentisphaerales bacterium]|jgi:benzoyl-CoA reductase/2-hydroxyglutaryl-CoA dehydratase subunit BcrC/BadD/HgdB